MTDIFVQFSCVWYVNLYCISVRNTHTWSHTRNGQQQWDTSSRGWSIQFIHRSPLHSFSRRLFFILCSIAIATATAIAKTQKRPKNTTTKKNNNNLCDLISFGRPSLSLFGDYCLNIITIFYVIVQLMVCFSLFYVFFIRGIYCCSCKVPFAACMFWTGLSGDRGSPRNTSQQCWGNFFSQISSGISRWKFNARMINRAVQVAFANGWLKDDSSAA